jgi:hypothetical protein
MGVMRGEDTPETESVLSPAWRWARGPRLRPTLHRLHLPSGCPVLEGITVIAYTSSCP